MELEKEGQTESKTNRRKKIINIRAEIKMENRITIEKVKETKSWFFENSTKLDTLYLAGSTEKKGKTAKIRNKKEYINTITEIKKNMKVL